jgi:tetratricopeptide (TPR) repeat protein
MRNIFLSESLMRASVISFVLTLATFPAIAQSTATTGPGLAGYLIKGTAKKALPLSYVLDTADLRNGSGKEWRKKKSREIDCLNRLIAKDRKNSKLYVSRARLRADLEIFDGADADYKYAYDLRDRSKDFLMAFGKFSRNRGQRANAITCFNSILKRDSTDAAAYLYRGITTLSLAKSRLNSLKERCEDSVFDFDKAVRYHSTLLPALILSGYVHYYLGFNEPAIRGLTMALRQGPNEVSFLLLGKAYLETDHPEKACEAFVAGARAGFEMPDKLVRKACSN